MRIASSEWKCSVTIMTVEITAVGGVINVIVRTVQSAHRNTFAVTYAENFFLR